MSTAHTSVTLGVALVACLPMPSRAAVADNRAGGADAMAWNLPQLRNEDLRRRCNHIYEACERLARHQLSLVRPWAEEPSMALATDSKSTENFIRPNTGIVAGLAFLHHFGPYDDGRVGLSRSGLLQTKIIPMVRYLTATHLTGTRPTGDGKRWGDAWQSAHWAGSLGLAAWWLGTDLPEELGGAVRRVVAHEADRIAATSPPHQVEKDSKSEENAWNSQILSVAVVLMPADSRRATWEKAFRKWVLSAYLRAADATAKTIVDGTPISEQFTGANIHDDFTLENHHIVHPDYMTAFSLSLGCMLEFVMTGRRPPEALLYNIPGIYENLKWFSLPDGGLVYPSGQDWSLFRHPDWLYPHLLVAVFGRDDEAWPLADQALDTFERMQARNTSGAVYLPEENFFASAHADRLYQLARCWLAMHFAEHVAVGPPPRRAGIRRLDAGRIILNRTPSAVHAVSWGARVMAQCISLRMDRLISPHDRSGVGHVILNGGKQPLPLSVRDAKVTSGADRFAAGIVLDHGKAVTAYLDYRSEPDGSWYMRERLVAAADFDSTEIATGLIGVLNNRGWIHEAGRRVVTLDGRRAVVSSCDGQLLEGNGVRAIDIDGVMRISSPRPLKVCYRAASEYVRGRVTDELYLHHLSGMHHFKAGDVIAEWEATVVCVPEETPATKPFDGASRPE